jgi:hypothetical protein
MWATVLIVVCALLASSNAFNVATNRIVRRSAFLEMKGKGGRIPINQRGEYMKQQKMMELKKQMEGDGKEDVPVFQVYVRPKAGGLWIPVGDLAGDNRATAVVNAWMSGFLTDTYKGQLDQGVAKSIFAQGDAFATNIIENYKPFRKFSKEDLQFGYKVKFPGLEEKVGEQKITPIVEGMDKNFADNIREGFANLFGKK